jgi:putative methyltransferase (TIGR04325 family)
MHISELIPPILMRCFRRQAHGRPTLFPSYAAALEASHGGWNDLAVARVVCTKTGLYRNWLQAHTPVVCDFQALRTCMALSLSEAHRAGTFHVIDVGGACGAHYFLAQAWLGDMIDLRWHVVERPTVVALATGVLADEHLTFYDSLDAARKDLDHIDLMFSSGTLQYMPDPYTTLAQLTSCRASSLFLTRMGLSPINETLVTVQTSQLRDHGPGQLPPGLADAVLSYPVTLMQQDRVEAIIAEQYRIELVFHEETNAYQAGPYRADMWGYFGALEQSSGARGIGRGESV